MGTLFSIFTDQFFLALNPRRRRRPHRQYTQHL